MKDKEVKRGLSLLQKRNLKGFLFVVPWLVGFILFYVRSIAMTIGYSFSNMTTEGAGGYTLSFAGFDNYIYAFRVHGSFKQVLTTSMMNMVVDVPLIIFFSLFMAMMLNRKFKGRTIVRAIFFLPIIMNAGAITSALELARTMMAGGISSGSSEVSSAAASGVDVNYFINLFKNLAMPEKVLDYIVSAVGRINDIISASGVQIIIFIAALQSIPGSMYEVAKIEGATAYETFWKVTFPMVMPHILTNVVYTFVDKFAISDVVELAYKTCFSELNYGLSSAMSLVSTILVCLLLVLVCGFIQKRTFYYN